MWVSTYAVVGLLAIVLNTATIVTFIVSRNLQRRSFYSLINLAVADMVQGIVRLLNCPCAFEVLGINCTLQTKSLMLSLMWLSAFASLLALLVISLQRVYAVVYPFQNQTLSTRKYAVVFGANWSFPLLMALLNYFVPIRLEFTLASFSFGLVLIFVIFLSYIAVFIEVRKQNKLLQHQQQQQQSTIRQRRPEAKLVKTLFIITGLCLITWLPFLAFRFVLHPSINVIIHFNVYYGILLAQFSSAFFNPIVYALRMKEFRNSFLKVTCKCRRRHRIEATR